MCRLATPAILRTSVHFSDPCDTLHLGCINGWLVILPVQTVITSISGWISLWMDELKRFLFTVTKAVNERRRQVRFHPSLRLQSSALKQTNSFSNGLHRYLPSNNRFPLWLQLVVIIFVWQKWFRRVQSVWQSSLYSWFTQQCYCMAQ